MVSSAKATQQYARVNDYIHILHCMVGITRVSALNT